MNTNSTVSPSYAFISDEKEASNRARIARLRSQMFSLSPSEQDKTGEEIARLKAECAANWDARARHNEGKRLEGMGF